MWQLFLTTAQMAMAFKQLSFVKTIRKFYFDLQITLGIFKHFFLTSSIVYLSLYTIKGSTGTRLNQG